MSKLSVEDIKRSSRGLRGLIEETLKSDATHFEEEEYQLLKFHGTYQQDDRDQRAERRKQKLDKAWSFMVRSKMPGGRVTAEQYLVHEDLAEKLGNGTLRLTTRQGIQLHGILKGGLKDVIRTIKDSGLTTWGACGDVVRNTMGPASPIADKVHQECQRLAEEISDIFLPTTSSYAQIWLDGEKLELDEEGEIVVEEDEIYGKEYLPRKFKIGIAVPPRNDVDVYSQDVSLVPHLEDGEVAGYTILVGGGFGMTHGMVQTRPVLAKPLAYVAKADTAAVVKAIVKVQREYGNRKDRKLARLKYLVETAGIKWFRNAVKSRSGCTLHEPKELKFTTVSDCYGWHEQGDGKLFRCVYVSQGRIEDTETMRNRSAFREIARQFGLPFVITPNANLIVHDVEPDQKDAVEAVLKEHGLKNEEEFTEARRLGHACVALPTCGLALAESERVFSGMLDSVDEILFELGLEKEPLLIRMTGCPNGCARPYNADLAFVGRGPGRYAFYVGGSSAGDRLSGLHTKTVKFEEIPAAIRPLLEDFAKNREEGENFTAFWGRTRPMGPRPDPEQFHVELAERAESLVGAGI